MNTELLTVRSFDCPRDLAFFIRCSACETSLNTPSHRPDEAATFDYICFKSKFGKTQIFHRSFVRYGRWWHIPEITMFFAHLSFSSISAYTAETTACLSGGSTESSRFTCSVSVLLCFSWLSTVARNTVLVIHWCVSWHRAAWWRWWRSYTVTNTDTVVCLVMQPHLTCRYISWWERVVSNPEERHD